MGEILPILGVVVFWVIVGLIACAMFGRWLKVPTEGEEEAKEAAEHEHTATQEDGIKANAVH